MLNCVRVERRALGAHGGCAHCSHPRPPRQPQRCLTRAVPEPLLQQPPDFDEPPRVPTEDEAVAVAAGALLTPQQQLAASLGLDLAVPLPLLAPGLSERRLMAQIQESESWQGLEAVILQRVSQPALAAAVAVASRGDTRAAAGAGGANGARGGAGAGGSVKQGAQLMQGIPAAAPGAAPAQPHAAVPQRPPRRRQAPQPLSVQPRAQQPAAGGAPTADAATTSLPQAAARSTLPLPLLNAMHVTEAVRRAARLLPAGLDLPGEGQQRARTLAALLAAQAEALAGRGELDVRGAAHIASGMARLGCADAALLAALQAAVLGRLPELTGQHAALLLGALARARVSPDEDLLPALQGRLLQQTPRLFTQRGLAATIMALAKLQTSTVAGGVGGDRAAGGGGSGSGGSGGNVLVSEKLRDALTEHCGTQMQHWTGDHLAQAAWGLARLQARVDAAWARTLLRASRRRLTSMAPRDLAMLAAALPELGISPPPEWLVAFCTTAAAKTPHAVAIELHSTLFGLAKLRRCAARSCAGPWPPSAPGRSALLALLRRALVWLQRRQEQLTARQLCGVLLSLAELTPPSVLARAGELHQLQGALRLLPGGDGSGAGDGKTASGAVSHAEVASCTLAALLPRWLDAIASRALPREAACSAAQARQLDAAAATLREGFFCNP